MKNSIKLIRVKHWIKNGLVLLPIIFSNSFTEKNIIKINFAFFAFCCIASSIYIFNDIKDAEKDRNHPQKRKRPIASGVISKKKAYVIGIVLIIIGLIFNYYGTGQLFNKSLIFLLLYYSLNLLYSSGLKNIPILDVIILASGFVIRVYYGASVISVPVSSWLFLTVSNASLFMALGKRKKELDFNKQVRKVLEYYDSNFLNHFFYVCLTLTLVFYSLWTTEQSNSLIFLSIPILTVIFMQYTLFIEKNEDGDPTTILFKNKFILLTALIYILFMFYVIGVG